MLYTFAKQMKLLRLWNLTASLCYSFLFWIGVISFTLIGMFAASCFICLYLEGLMRRLTCCITMAFRFNLYGCKGVYDGFDILSGRG